MGLSCTPETNSRRVTSSACGLRRTSSCTCVWLAPHPKARSGRCGIATHESLSPLQRHHQHTTTRVVSRYPMQELARGENQPPATDLRSSTDCTPDGCPPCFMQAPLMGLKEQLACDPNPNSTMVPKDRAEKKLGVDRGDRYSPATLDVSPDGTSSALSRSPQASLARSSGHSPSTSKGGGGRRTLWNHRNERREGSRLMRRFQRRRTITRVC